VSKPEKKITISLKTLELMILFCRLKLVDRRWLVQSPYIISLTIDDWTANGPNFCEPVGKSPDDREALRQVIREGTKAS
jgi:hypothetical protein